MRPKTWISYVKCVHRSVTGLGVALRPPRTRATLPARPWTPHDIPEVGRKSTHRPSGAGASPEWHAGVSRTAVALLLRGPCRRDPEPRPSLLGSARAEDPASRSLRHSAPLRPGMSALWCPSTGWDCVYSSGMPGGVQGRPGSVGRGRGGRRVAPWPQQIYMKIVI